MMLNQDFQIILDGRYFKDVASMSIDFGDTEEGSPVIIINGEVKSWKLLNIITIDKKADFIFVTEE